MKLIQHIPNFCEGFTPKEVEFKTLEELFETPWVKKYKNTAGDRFHKWSISDRNLMIEENKGSYWWVVGTLDDEAIKNLDLPKWEPGKE